MLLYKYFAPSENAFKSLVRRGLWCHHPSRMNDPFECLAAVDRNFTPQEIEEFRVYVLNKFSDDALFQKLVLLPNNIFVEKVNQHRRARIAKYAFCSLSTEYDNILMWSHYTNAHKGFVVGFEFSELQDNHHLRPVNYVSTMPPLDLISWANALSLNSEGGIHYIMDDLSMKSSVWAYEKEWRIWRKEPGYYAFAPGSVKEVYFGINCEDEVKAIVGKLFSYLGDDFLFYDMEFDKGRLALVR